MTIQSTNIFRHLENKNFDLLTHRKDKLSATKAAYQECSDYIKNTSHSQWHSCGLIISTSMAYFIVNIYILIMNRSPITTKNNCSYFNTIPPDKWTFEIKYDY